MQTSGCTASACIEAAAVVAFDCRWGGSELDGGISCRASFDPVEVVASRKQGTIVLLLDSLVRCSFEDCWRLVSS